jgi:hypothetical protein
MMRHIFPGFPGFESVRRSVVFICWLSLAAVSLPAATKFEWRAVNAAELAAVSPEIEPDAPAEVVFWELSVDDRDYPETRRIHEYVRFKIFAPDQVERLTRISQRSAMASGFERDAELRARLILPDGRIQEFGRDAIRERQLTQSAVNRGWLDRLFRGAGGVTERFLAVSGVEAGAILEYQTVRRIRPSSILSAVLQRDDLPVRQVKFVQQVGRDPRIGHRVFLLNRSVGAAQVDVDEKKKTVTATAQNLPSLRHEEYGAPVLDYALAVLSSYWINEGTVATRRNANTVRVNPQQDGPWSPYATVVHMQDMDRAHATRRVQELTASVVQHATTPLERAQAIYADAQQRWRHYDARPRQRGRPRSSFREVRSLDDVLGWEQQKDTWVEPVEFRWLTLAMFREAGLDASLVMLPTRKLMRFNPTLVSPALVPAPAIMVMIDGTPWFCDPFHAVPLPFGLLPAEHTNAVGLRIKSGPQELVQVPATPAESSGTTISGRLVLSATGDLSGQCVRGYTGQLAHELREQLVRRTEEERETLVRDLMLEHGRAAEVRVLSLTGVDEGDQPIVATFEVNWPGYAVAAGSRLILKPAVFRAGAPAMFTASQRRTPVQFPFPWHEVEQIELILPEDFVPEAPVPPRGAEAGDLLQYRTVAQWGEESRTLLYRRDFVSRLDVIPAQNYSVLKQWFDDVALYDQAEWVFQRKPQTAAVAP